MSIVFRPIEVTVSVLTLPENMFSPSISSQNSATSSLSLSNNSTRSSILPSALMAVRARDAHALRSFISVAFSPLHYRLRSNPFNLSRNLSTSSDKHPLEWENFTGKSAYEVLGVSQSSSFSEIKSSFRKLAKETHPDVAANLDSSSAASQQFLQILAAYEVVQLDV